MNRFLPFSFIENANFKLFGLINASDATHSNLIAFARFAADDIIYLFPLVLAALWLWGRPEKRGRLLVTFLGAELGLLFNQIIPLFWFHPRPFMIPIGHTLIPHAADSSFPSDHITFMAAIALGLWLLAGYRLISAACFALTILVAWSRIYLGVHFPLDMAGGLAIGALGLGLVRPILKPVETRLMANLVLPIYRRVFSFPIRNNWCRP
ncbi:undecaprenyl-diphosphatase [Roseibium aggregatum]|uniref:Undecaprenyl-diphosphatase n=1 Tax=Roseibium aggregatum TaxID=187304 RepID=A0A926NXQ6_9HYPH|nr:undecaprenyl-diphosphatase [Roseibium aggregatum]MBD1546256.1 undecaprenyl-diphosphatase [Roseibium aggregatum]